MKILKSYSSEQKEDLGQEPDKHSQHTREAVNNVLKKFSKLLKLISPHPMYQRGHLAVITS